MSDFEDKLNSILSSPKDMERIMELARSIGGGGENTDSNAEKQPRHEQEGIDPQLMGMLGRIMSEYSAAGNDDKLEILRMMSPYLKEERKQGLKKAVDIARMAKVAKIAFSGFSGGEKYP